MSEQIIYKNNPLRILIITGIGVGLIIFGIVSGVHWDDYNFEINGYISTSFVGIGLFFKGLWGFFNRKPQLIIDKTGLYVGLKVKKQIPWKNIEGFTVRQEDDETGRGVWKLKIRTFRMKNGFKTYIPLTLDLDLLKIDRTKILDEIKRFRKN